ncbi:MAG: hypothetical protein KBT48_00185 [Firmicutes bacterium]|nr:hypothetical protein [Bacillota bacterium]
MSKELNIVDYKKSKFYQRLKPNKQKELEAFCKENQIERAHLSLLVALQEWKHMPKEEKNKGNEKAEYLLVVCVMFFVCMGVWGSMNMKLISAVMVLCSATIYATAILNPETNRMRKIKKALKKYPKVPEFNWES